jgi:hypothetical protein
MVTPLGPNSAAQDCVNNRNAALDDPYSAPPIIPKCAAIVVIFTMRPHLRAAIEGARRPVRKYGARTLVANMDSNVSAVVSAVGPNEKIPALLTRMSTVPQAFSLIGETGDSARGGQIPDDKVGVTTSGLDDFHYCTSTGSVTPRDDDANAICCKSLCDRPANARCRAGYQGATNYLGHFVSLGCVMTSGVR